MKKKITAKEVTAYLLRDGVIEHQNICRNNTYLIVRSHGHRYWIDDPYGNHPRISQLPDEQNVTKN